MSETLLPCPFCGGPAEVQAAIDWPNHRQVTCQSCAANTYGTRCVERWNRRAPGPATEEPSCPRCGRVQPDRRGCDDLFHERETCILAEEVR
jgi:hypothetical protein